MHRYMAFAALCLAASPTHAGELVAREAASIEIGGFQGVVYYTNEHDGYRVVATIAAGEAGPPVRFIATLAESQGMTISAPGEIGAHSQELEVLRMDGKLLVNSDVPASDLVRGGPHALGE